ncbi:MAG: hypothetical protein ABR500_16405, partial [Dermatophilaceae bacterium]
MDVTGPSTAQVAAAIELIVALQASPTTACSYLGTAPDGIRAELDHLEVPWRDTLRFAVDGHGTVVGAVIVDWDEEIHRSWIHGPWTRDERPPRSRPTVRGISTSPPSLPPHAVGAWRPGCPAPSGARCSSPPRPHPTLRHSAPPPPNPAP